MGSAKDFNRRDLLKGSAAILAGTFISGCSISQQYGSIIKPVRSNGPASKYIPAIKAAFVRRKEDYGMWWPGDVFDGQAALQSYTCELEKAARVLGVKLDIRPQPIYSDAEADNWCAEIKNSRPDGQVIIVLDRQQHSWPTVHKAADLGVPTVILAPLGTAFTTTTAYLSQQPGCLICSHTAKDLPKAMCTLKFLETIAKIRHTRCIVIQGDERLDTSMADIGIKLRYIPTSIFLEKYNAMPLTKTVSAMADDYIKRARRRQGATGQDVVNGIKSYLVATDIIKSEEGDAITMDCLVAIGKQNMNVSLPCIAWSRMNDDGIPAACQADLGAVASHIIVQYLFDRPGFQQNPVPDTINNSIIGAHCSCPTRLNGFNEAPEPFDLVHHHGNRDAVPRTLWKEGQRITSIDILPGDKEKKTEMLISTGTVLENLDVPPNGGCVVSVNVKFDGNQPVLSFPDLHQVFFYGDYKQQLLQFCQLSGLAARVV